MSTMPGPAAKGRETPLSAERFVTSCPEPALALDADDCVVAVSAAFARTFGHHRGATVGRRFGTLVHPDDAPEASRRIAQARRSPEPTGFGHRIRTSGGDYVRVDSVVDCMAGGRVRVISHDVTTQVELVSALSDRVDAWEAMFDHIGDGIVVIDRAGRVVAANEAAGSFLGVDSKQLGGSIARAQVVVIDEHGHPIERDRLPSSRAFATGVTQEEPVAYRRRDGSVVWLYARAIPLRRPGELEPSRVAIVLEDAIASPIAQAPPPIVTDGVLTPRERDVLHALADGLDVRAIAGRLDISLHTARGHVKRIMQKLDARTQLQAVVVGVRAGLVDVRQPPPK